MPPHPMTACNGVWATRECQLASQWRSEKASLLGLQLLYYAKWTRAARKDFKLFLLVVPGWVSGQGLVSIQNRKAKQSVSTAIQKLGLLSYFHMHFCLSWKKNLDLEEPLNTCHSSCPHNNPSSARLDLLARAAPGQRLSSLALPPGELLLYQAGRAQLGLSDARGDPEMICLFCCYCCFFFFLRIATLG